MAKGEGERNDGKGVERGEEREEGRERLERKGRGRRRGDETSRRKEGAVGIIIILVIACSAG